jgi:hypothetical protein
MNTWSKGYSILRILAGQYFDHYSANIWPKHPVSAEEVPAMESSPNVRSNSSPISALLKYWRMGKEKRPGPTGPSWP